MLTNPVIIGVNNHPGDGVSNHKRKASEHYTSFRKNISVLPQDLYTSFRKILTNVPSQSKHGSERKQASFWTEASIVLSGSKHDWGGYL